MTDSHIAGEELVDARWASMPASGETVGHAWSIAQTLGAELERVRLAHRTRRIERVLVSLRERRAERARAGPVPPALSQAIDDFSRELAQLRAQLSVAGSTAEPASPAHVVGVASTTIVSGKARA